MGVAFDHCFILIIFEYKQNYLLQHIKFIILGKHVYDRVALLYDIIQNVFILYKKKLKKGMMGRSLLVFVYLEGCTIYNEYRILKYHLYLRAKPVCNGGCIL